MRRIILVFRPSLACPFMPPSAPPRIRVSSQLRQWLLWSGRVLLAAYFVGALLILAGRHFLMPELAAQREFVEQRLSAAIGLPVQIAGLSASWPGMRPHLMIEGMQLFDAAGRPALSFERVEAEVGWASLWLRGLRLHRLAIHAPALDIHRDAAGGLHVAGLPMDWSGGTFADWLLAQGRIVVRDARVTWRDDLRGAPPLELRDLDFELRNAGRHHSFGFVATPPEGVAARLDLRGNLVGAALDDLAGWRGDLYADLERAELAAWSPWLDLPVEWTRGRGRLRLWLGFANLAPTSFTAELGLSDVAVRLGAELPVLELDYLDGRIAGKRNAHGYEGALRRLTLATRDGITVAPADVRFSVDLRGGREAGELHIDKLDIGALAALAGRLPLPASVRTPLAALTPGGRLADVDLSWRGLPEAPRGWRVKGQFEDLALAPWRELPGFGGITGSIEGDEKAGTLRLDSRDVRIDLPRVFPEPTLTLAALQAEIGWRVRGADIEFLFPRLAFHNDDARGEATGSYRTTGSGPGEIDLSAKLTQVAGNAVWRYMPLAVDANARDWLRAGIIGGRSETASLRLKGPLAEFPFRGGKGGIFQVRGTIKGASLDYAEGWPQMTDIDGELLFENERMTIRGQRASIMGVALADIVAEIPDLEADQEVLHVRGRAQGPTQRFLDFIEASPVGGMIDHFTAPMQASGDGELQLKLTIPLRQFADTAVDGRYRFSANELRVLPELPVFSATQGELAFTAEHLTAKNLRARFLGMPVTAEVSTRHGGAVRVDASGRLAARLLRQQPEFGGFPLFDHLSGETPWRASVTIRKPAAEVVVESTLEGLASSLPEPFNKSARTALPFRLDGRVDAGGAAWMAPHARKTRSLPPTGGRMPPWGGPAAAWTGTLGQVLALHAEQRDGAWRGQLALGADVRTAPPALPERGLALRMAQPHIDIDAWRALLAANGNQAAGEAARMLPKLVAIELATGEARLLGRSFHDLRFTGTRQEDGWRLAIDSREAQGRLNWEAAGAGRLAGRFARLRLPAEERPAHASRQVRPVQEGDLPALDLVVDDLRLHGMDFGAARFVGATRSGIWQGELEIANAAARLDGSLRWRPGIVASDSSLDFKLEIADAEKLLSHLGLPDALRRGSGRLEGSLAWPGTPQDFALADLSGRLATDLRKGQFKKLEPGVGRLLGVLSLQALPRRIVLDFRDVFSEGFAFDSIAGEARIAGGRLRTEDLQMRGPAARVHIAGQASLIDETQDLKVRVQPAIGDTVALGAMLANPVVGAVTWLAQRALGDPLDQAFAYTFAVSGPWSDPQVEKLVAKPGKAGESPP